MMADVDRKARIAAARKKLKQIQKNQSTTSSSPITTDDQAPNQTKHECANDVSGVDFSRSVMDDSPEDASEKSRRNSFDVLKSSSLDALPQDEAVKMPASNSVTTLSTEKLYSLSRQVTGLMSETTAYLNGDISTESSNVEDLEKRNQELAEKLEKLSQNNKMLQVQLEEVKQHNDKLQQSLESDRKTFDEKLKRDLGALKEQLQVHVQTVGILVAEKQELQTACNQTAKLAETRQAEVEELAGRLKASRQRVTDLEKNLSTSNSTNQKLDRSNKELVKDLEKLKMETYKNNKSREELQQHNLELQGRLQQKIHEMTKLEDINIELKGKLEMSELYLEQLKNGQDRPDSNVSKQIEKILTEKTELQTKLQQQEDAVKLINRERESMIGQYNQYVEQLQQQNKDLLHQVEKMSKEKENSSLKIEDLESSLSQLKSKQAEVTDDRIHEHEEKARLVEDVESLVSQLMVVSKNLEVQVADNSQLSRLVIEKEQTILELEQQLEKASSSTVDQDKLLETMNSDKTALSRAMAQNKELKSQFLELQEQFVKMSQKNMEVMTKLQGEEHNSRELQQRFCVQEEELKQLRHLLEEKSRSVDEMERTKEESRQTNGTSSSEDEDKAEENKRLAELFRRKVPLIENLQKELSSAQDAVNALTNQNAELRNRIRLLENAPPPPVLSNDLATSDFKPSPNVDLLKTKITHLEMEKLQLSEQLKESQKMKDIIKEKLEDFQQDLARQAPATMNGDIVTRVHFEALQHAMKQLEEKYTRTMRDKAEMVDKMERLEHIVLQLQGETDTIGEYVSLYHQQRYLMKQRTAEKDCRISRLSTERMQLRSKLRQLQALVVQLLGEKNSPTEEVATFDPANDLGLANGVEADGRKRGAAKGEEEEDWPDYSESSDEEARPKQLPETPSSSDAPLRPSKHSLPSLPPRDVANIPSSPSSSSSSESTVLKIMHLLNEIDSSSVADDDGEFLRITFFCQNCTGKVFLV